MKTLKESILDDIDTNIAKGDEYAELIDKLFKEVKQRLSKHTNWSKAGAHGYMYYWVDVETIKLHDFESINTLLKHISYDADRMYFKLETPPQFNVGKGKGVDYWKLYVVLTK